jgi:hypothetical protein
VGEPDVAHHHHGHHGEPLDEARGLHHDEHHHGEHGRDEDGRGEDGRDEDGRGRARRTAQEEGPRST